MPGSYWNLLWECNPCWKSPSTKRFQIDWRQATSCSMLLGRRLWIIFLISGGGEKHTLQHVLWYAADSTTSVLLHIALCHPEDLHHPETSRRLHNYPLSIWSWLECFTWRMLLVGPCNSGPCIDAMNLAIVDWIYMIDARWACARTYL